MALKVEKYVEEHIPYGKFRGFFREFLVEGLSSKSPAWRASDAVTLDIEAKGRVLVASGKAGVVGEVIPFVIDVLDWGGKTGSRVRGNLFKHNSDEEIAYAMGKSAQFLQEGKLREAIETITDSLVHMKLGYGSKMLRMMSPQQAAAVRDGYLGKIFDYPDNEDGYVNFCRDCRKVAKALEREQVKNPFRIKGEWYVADVEAVIFRQTGVEEGK